MKAILVDDETLALDFLEQQLNKIGGVDVVAKLTNFNIEKDSHLLKDIDIVFLDIEMPGMNGLELAEKMLEFDANLSIVFVTAFNRYAVQAFELNVLDYLLKPVQVDRLKKTIERIEEQQSLRRDLSSFSTNILKVNVCRELSFELVEGRPEILHWRTTKAQELFLYLLLHSGTTVSKYKLTELIWEDFEQEKAYSQLYTAIYHIRKTLQPFANHFSLKNINEGYILHTSNVSIDVVEWEKAVDLLPSSVTTETIKKYEKTMALYQGSLLNGYHYLWLEAECYRLEQIWVRVAYRIANYYFANDDLEKAEKWYVKIEELRPEEEKVYFSLMKLYDQFGYGMLVNHQYEQLKKIALELNAEVSPHVKEWYDEWAKRK